MSVVDSLLKENEMLRDRIEILEDMLGMSAPVPAWLDLTPSEGRVLGFLAMRGSATKEQIYGALYGLRIERDQPDFKIVDVFICKIRKHLKPAKITISTIWGIGYALEGESLLAARRALGIKDQERKAA